MNIKLSLKLKLGLLLVLSMLSIIIIVNLFGWSILVPYLRRHPLLQQLTTDTPQFLLMLFIPIHII